MKQTTIWQALVMASLLANMGIVEAREVQQDTISRQATQIDRIALRQDTHQTMQSMAREFAGFAGSQENAEALFTGMINGTPILLNGESKVERHGRSTLVTIHGMIIPPTKPMGFGDAYVAMTLIKAQFAAADIAQPSVQQLQSALMAGSDNAEMLNIGELQLKQQVLRQGILTQRAAGRNWQAIARENGVALAQLQQALQDMQKSEMLAAREASDRKPLLNTQPTPRFGVVSASSSVVLGTRAGGL